MIKENDTSNLKLLTEKLNDGFYVEDRIEVGRSTVVTLQKRRESNTRSVMRNYVQEMADSLPVDLGSEYGVTSEGN